MAASCSTGATDLATRHLLILGDEMMREIQSGRHHGAACLLLVGRPRWCQEAEWHLQKALRSRVQSTQLMWSESQGATLLCDRHAFSLLLLELAARGHARHAALHVSCFARYESKINKKTPIIGVYRSKCTDLSAFGIDDSIEWPITEPAIQRVLTQWTSLGLWENPQGISAAVQNTVSRQGSFMDTKSIRMTTEQQLSMEGFDKATKEGGSVQDSGQTQPEMKKVRADLAVEACRKHTTAMVRHSVKERQRRARIKHCCLNMKSLLPLNPNKRADMASVLEAAVSYLHVVLPLLSAQQMEQFSKYLQGNKNYHQVTNLAKEQYLRTKSICLLQPNPLSSAEKLLQQTSPGRAQLGEHKDERPSHEKQSLCCGSVMWLPDSASSHNSYAPLPSHKDVYKSPSVKLIHSRPVVHQVMNPTIEKEPSHWQPMPYKPMLCTATCTRLQVKTFSYDSEVSAFGPISSAAHRQATTAEAILSSASSMPCDEESCHAVTPSWLTSSASYFSIPLVTSNAPAQNEVIHVQRESTARPLLPAQVSKQTMNYQQVEVSDNRNVHSEGPLNFKLCNLKVDKGLLEMPSSTDQQLKCLDGPSSSTQLTDSHATPLATQRSQEIGGEAGVSGSHLEWDKFIIKLLYS